MDDKVSQDKYISEVDMTDKKTLANVLAGTGIIASLFTTGIAGIKAFASKNEEMKVPDISTPVPSASAITIPSSSPSDEVVETEEVVEDEAEETVIEESIEVLPEASVEPSVAPSIEPSLSPAPSSTPNDKLESEDEDDEDELEEENEHEDEDHDEEDEEKDETEYKTKKSEDHEDN